MRSIVAERLPSDAAVHIVRAAEAAAAAEPAGCRRGLAAEDEDEDAGRGGSFAARGVGAEPQCEDGRSADEAVGTSRPVLLNVPLVKRDEEPKVDLAAEKVVVGGASVC